MADKVRILIPLDGSKLAEHSLAYVPALKPLGEEVVELALVLEDGHEGSEHFERAKNTATSYLHEVASEVHQHVGVEVDTKLVTGHAPQAIIEEADAFDADFVVISTHGASGITRWRRGSVADKVIRSTDRNVLVVGPRAAEREQWLLGELLPAFKTILVPLDGSELAEEALPVAQRFAEAFDAELHLVRVVILTAMGTDAVWASSYSEEVIDGLTAEATEYLKVVADKLSQSVKARLNVQIGLPADSLSAYVTEENVDLVVMTSHGRSGLARAALGSITDRLLGEAAPVLVVRNV